MATFVWTGTSSALWSLGANWNVGGVAQASPPTAADDVVFGTGTGATNNACTVAANAVCRSLDFGASAYSGTFTLNGSTTISIGDATAGTGNIALRMSSAMTFTNGGGSSSLLSFVSTSATQQTITFNGKKPASVTFAGAGSSYQLQDAMTQWSTNGVLTHTDGTLDLSLPVAVPAVSMGSFTGSGANLRTLTLGSGTYDFTNAGTAWSFSTSTNLTLTANTATIRLTGAGQTINIGAMNMNGATVLMNGSGNAILAGTGTLTNLQRVGTAVTTDTLALNTNIIVTNLTVTGNSSVNTVAIKSNTAGTQRSMTTSGTYSFTNVGTITDMIFAGQKFDAPSTAVNGGNNSGIAFVGKPSFIQASGVSKTSAGPNVAATFTTATRDLLTTTSCLVAAIQLRTATTPANVSSVTDDKGNTWVAMNAGLTSTFGTGQGTHDWWWCPSVTTGGVTSVTVNASINSNFGITIFELTDANTVDQISLNTSAGASTSPATAGPTGTTTAANEAILTATGWQTSLSTIGASTGYTMQTTRGSAVAPVLTHRAGVETATATGTFSTSMTSSVTGVWVASIVSLKYVAVVASAYGGSTMPLMGIG